MRNAGRGGGGYGKCEKQVKGKCAGGGANDEEKIKETEILLNSNKSAENTLHSAVKKPYNGK